MRLPYRLRHLLATRPIVYWSLTLALAAGTAVIVQRLTTDAAEARQRWGDTRPTLVVTHPVAAGERLSEANAAVRELPLALRPDGALEAMPAAPAPAVATALATGEIVTAARLGRAGRSELAGLLPDATRGVAVVVPDGLALVPGDVVDVVAATGVVAHAATVVRVAEQVAVLAVSEAQAPIVARATTDGDAVVVLAP